MWATNNTSEITLPVRMYEEIAHVLAGAQSHITKAVCSAHDRGGSSLRERIGRRGVEHAERARRRRHRGGGVSGGVYPLHWKRGLGSGLCLFPKFFFILNLHFSMDF
jgi:hypothetical protein